jgi:hypothetical protein
MNIDKTTIILRLVQDSDQDANQGASGCRPAGSSHASTCGDTAVSIDRSPSCGSVPMKSARTPNAHCAVLRHSRGNSAGSNGKCHKSMS